MTPFEKEKNRKALFYTLGICGIVAILLFLISWTNHPPAPPLTQDLIDINLGNLEEGYGNTQPLVKGGRSPMTEESPVNRSAANRAPSERMETDDRADDDAAAVVNSPKKDPKSKSDKPAENKRDNPQKPKLTYNGPGNQNGNNAAEDNGYRYEGNKPDGKGDAGDPEGNKDSYGNSPGGKTGNGPQVTKGNRKIVKSYSFTGNLGKATVYAIIRVSPSGKGTFTGFDKGSSTRNPAYRDAIISYLNNMSFNASDNESVVTVRFNFDVK